MTVRISTSNERKGTNSARAFSQSRMTAGHAVGAINRQESGIPATITAYTGESGNG